MSHTSIRIGDLLLQRQLVVHNHLEVAVAAQRLRGGRLGSWLVVQGAASADLIAQGLGEQLSVLAASERAVRAVGSGSLGIVPRNFCERYAILPLLVERGTLHLAMLDPAELDLINHLGQVLGCAVQPYAVADVLLRQALETYYQIPAPDCYKHPVTGPHPATSAGSTGGTRPGAAKPGTAITLPGGAVRPPPAPPAAAPPAAAASSDDLQLVFLDQATAEGNQRGDGDGFDIDIDFDDLAAEDLSGSVFDLKLTDEAAAGGGGLVSLEDVLKGLREVADKESVLAQLLRPTMSELSLLVVFRPVNELAMAIGAWGTGLTNEKVQQLRLPLLTPSLLQKCFDDKALVRGAADGDALQPMIANYLGVEAPTEACVAPVCIKQKVVNLVCLQTATAFGDELVSQVGAITQHAAAAYARMILQRKKAKR